MQGQGSSSDPSANNFYQNELDIINRWLSQQNVNSDESAVRNALNVLNQTRESSSSRLNVVNQRRESSSSLNNENQTSFVALLSEVHDDHSDRSQGSQGVQPENGQVQYGPSIVHPNNANLNDAVKEMGAGPSLHPSEPGANSSNPVLISSGIAGYILEEDHGGRGTSPDARRLSCKRRAPEDASRELTPAGSSASDHQARNSEQGDAGGLNKHINANHSGLLGAGLVVGTGAAPARHDRPNTGGTVLGGALGAATVNHRTSSGAANGSEGAPFVNQTSNFAGNGLVIGMGAVPRMIHQDSSGAGQEENFQRNIRLRINVNQQDLRASLNSEVQSPSQTAMFFPYDHFVDPSIPSPVHVAPRIPTFVRVPDPFQTQQLPPGINMPRTRPSSSSSVNVVIRRATQHQEGNLRNNPRNVMLPPEYQPGNFSHTATNLNSAAAAAASRGGLSSNFRIPSVPTWYHNVGQQYSNRLAEIASRSESRGQGNYFPILTGASADEQEMENSDEVGNIIRPYPRPRRSRLMQRAERQAGEYPAIFPAFRRSASPPLRRSRHLVSEVHNALALVRRGGGLRFEDVMVIDRSVLLDPREEDDIHEDMRLDIDNMTYEQLLALGEEIGNVCTGLTKEAVLANLTPRKYRSFKVGSPINDESCCICQEVYADGEDIGKLDCGHDFHVNCIKQWLMQKNQCPICKKTALAGKHRDH